MLAMSLHSEDDYNVVLATWHSPWAAPFEFLILWAFSFHVLAGVRHLLMDVA
jgi:succinate dehydrogenase / fumarate reductase cytochrome b subunit